MELGAGGLAIGLLLEPGPGVLPGGHGLATVVEVPPGCEVLPAIVAEVEPAPLVAVELPIPLVELLLVEGAVVVVLLPGAAVELVEVPTLVPLLEGVHGATVVVVLDCVP